MKDATSKKQILGAGTFTPTKQECWAQQTPSKGILVRLGLLAFEQVER